MTKGTILYVGNFELPDHGASANRVMVNRLLFRELGYRTAYLGVVGKERFEGVRRSSFDPDVYERAYPASTRMWLESAYSLKDILAVVRLYPDIRFIILYNTPCSLARKAYRYFKKRGVTVLFDCTEWCSYTEGNLLKRLYKRYDAYQIQHHLERWVDGLFVVSSLMNRQYQKKPKAMLPPLMDLQAPMWKQKRTRADGEFEFCYAGDPLVKDDLCLMVDAFVKLNRPNTRLVVMGVPKEAFLQKHPEQEQVLAAHPDQILFPGMLPREQVIGRLINADCFVFIRKPTLQNRAGFPSKFSEAYSCGIRIISTDVSDIHQYLDPAIRLVQEASVSGIAEAMAWAVDSKRSARTRDAFDYRLFIQSAAALIEPFAAKDAKESG